MNFTEQEKEEIRRSAVEAARRTTPITANMAQITRYINSQENTAFPLEYSFYLLKNACAERTGITVLDYGCGAGEDLVPIANMTDNVIGLDISPELIEHARKRVEAHGITVRLIVGSAYATGLPAESVDIVFAIAIFHHLDLDAARQELYRIVKPDGAVVLQEPVLDSRLMNHVRALMPISDEISAYEKPLTCEQLNALSQGFDCESIRRFRLPFVAVIERILPRLVRTAYAWDARMLRSSTYIQHFATVEVRKLKKRAR
jgi:SAM-dependent methyltransferase